jgi:undecaprenyl-diphosphatase
VGGFLLLTAALLVLAELIGKRQRKFTDITWWNSLLIGISQAAAIAPGVSRSGATISVGMFCGLSREAAARFSFILAIPIITAAGSKSLYELLLHGDVGGEAPALIAGFITAGICGYVAIKFLLAFLRRRRLYVFSAYCLIAGILAITIL